MYVYDEFPHLEADVGDADEADIDPKIRSGAALDEDERQQREREDRTVQPFILARRAGKAVAVDESKFANEKDDKLPHLQGECAEQKGEHNKADSEIQQFRFVPTQPENYCGQNEQHIDVDGKYAVVLLNRQHWSPFSSAFLSILPFCVMGRLSLKTNFRGIMYSGMRFLSSARMRWRSLMAL